METLKEILEIVYFISGPVIAVFAFLGLKQIKEARNQVIEARNTRILNSKRDSFKIAAEKCTYYIDVIIPLINSLDSDIEEKKIDFFKRTKVTITDDEIQTVPVFENDSERQKVISLKVGTLFNPLEGFSLFFVSGVADEQVGYLSVGYTFCNSVKKYLPLIVPLSAGNKHYANLIKLFLIWNSRIEKERLETEKTNIEKQLAKKQDLHIKPIGTE